MENLKEFYQKYQQQSVVLNNKKEFKYRYYRHPSAKETIVLLTGGIGLSDLFYLHFERFAKDFSVITFDYQLQYDNNQQFSDAVAELLKSLGIKAWLVGQSFGGIVAQILAKEHPCVVEGMVLSNTCSLAKDMDEEAYQRLMGMIHRQIKSKRMLKIIPFNIFKKIVAKAVMRKTVNSEEAEKERIQDLVNAMLCLLTKEYEVHMINLMIDIKNHLSMTSSDFKVWDKKVLLLLSEDDDAFNQACKDSLISIMPNPKVITTLTGGHLALLIKLDDYADTVSSFIIAISKNIRYNVK